MTTKEFLLQYRVLSSRIGAIDRMIKEIRAELTGVGVATIGSPWPDGQPHGTGTTDPTGAQAIKAAEAVTEVYRQKLRDQLADLEVKGLRARSDLWEKRLEIEEALGQVKDPVHLDILQKAYIEGKRFELIAVELGYSYRHTIRLHGEALIEVDRIRKKSAEL